MYCICWWTINLRASLFAGWRQRRFDFQHVACGSWTIRGTKNHKNPGRHAGLCWRRKPSATGPCCARSAVLKVHLRMMSFWKQNDIRSRCIYCRGIEIHTCTSWGMALRLPRKIEHLTHGQLSWIALDLFHFHGFLLLSLQQAKRTSKFCSNPYHLSTWEQLSIPIAGSTQALPLGLLEAPLWQRTGEDARAHSAHREQLGVHLWGRPKTSVCGEHDA